MEVCSLAVTGFALTSQGWEWDKITGPKETSELSYLLSLCTKALALWARGLMFSQGFGHLLVFAVLASQDQEKANTTSFIDGMSGYK